MEEIKALSKLIKNKEPEPPSQPEKAEDEAMKPIQTAHVSLQEGYNGLEDLIEEVVSRNEWLLNSKC